MDDAKVTCPTCRGAKEMMKLGGMIGKCNLCHGSGKINHCDLPVIREILPAENVGELVKRVGEAVPWTGKSSKAVPAQEIQKPQPIQDTIKVERKKAIYKRKTTAQG
jgi:DnaJ-class molecular chaperone